MVGIKESKEALIGINELAIFIAKRLKDGVGMDDIGAIIDLLKNDGEFKIKVAAAFDGIKAVPEEMKDIDINEGVELAMVQVMYMPKIIEAFKK